MYYCIHFNSFHKFNETHMHVGFTIVLLYLCQCFMTETRLRLANDWLFSISNLDSHIVICESGSRRRSCTCNVCIGNESVASGGRLWETVNTDNWQMRILTTVPESRLPLLTTLNLNHCGSLRRLNKLNILEKLQGKIE